MDFSQALKEATGKQCSSEQCCTLNVFPSSGSQLRANALLVAPSMPQSLALKQLIDFQSVLRSSKRDEVLWKIRF